jgi:uncharacterized membrane protein YphA (DoxX/SURF4 family)
MNALLNFLGRLSLSLIFIFSAVGKIIGWEESEVHLIAGLKKFMIGIEPWPQFQYWIGIMISFAPLILLFAIFLELVGAILVSLGIQVKGGALLLLLFMIPTTLIMHPFWMVSAPDQQMEMINFMKNLSIIGGLFILLGSGGGKAPAKSK